MKFLALLIAAASSVVFAQHDPIEVGALLPLSGVHAPIGAAQRVALEASVAALRAAGITLELTLLDAPGDHEAATGAADLIGSGVHALICCHAPAATAQLAPAAAAANVPLLGLSALSTPVSGAGWVFSLAAEDVAVLGRLLLEPKLYPVGLLAPFGRAGNDAEALLEPVRGGAVRYPHTELPLTPEALLLATQKPASVVLWDGGAGTVRGAEALAARGYEGDVVVRGGVWAELGALERAKLTGAKSVVSPALLGYTLADTHPSKAAASSFRRALIGLPESSLTPAALEAAARAWDAALLLGRAAEQVLAYSSGEVTAATLRSALRDALVGLEPTTGAGGRYDFSEGRPNGLEPGSLVLAVWRGGRFRPGP